MYASYIGHDNIVKLLLESGVDVNVRNNKGQSSLLLAASCGNESVAFFLKQVMHIIAYCHIYPKWCPYLVRGIHVAYPVPRALQLVSYLAVCY